MSKVIRLSDGTYQQVDIRPGERVDNAISRILDAAEKETGMLECGFCGARAPMTEETMDKCFLRYG